MTLGRLLRRNLIYHWRGNCAVFGNNDRVPTQQRSPGRVQDADVRGEAGDHQGSDSGLLQNVVEVGVAEADPFDVARSATACRSIVAPPARYAAVDLEIVPLTARRPQFRAPVRQLTRR